MNLIKKLIIILLIAVVVGFLLLQKPVQEPILNFLNQNIPWSIPLFNFVKNEVSSGTLIGVTIYLVFANIPLLPSIPSEAYAIFAFSKGANLFGILFITTLISMIFASVYYFVGRFFGKRILEKMLKKPILYSPLLDRLSGIFVFLAYLIPLPFLPIPLTTVLVLLFGSYKTGFNRIVTAVGVGTFIRFLLIIIFYQQLPFSSWLKIG